MTSYFNACDVTVANSNHKIRYDLFSTCTCAPHFEKGSATHGVRVKEYAYYVKNFAKMFWKHEYDVKLWRHKECTPNK